MIGCHLREFVSQETLQTHRVGAPPCDSSFRVDPLKVPDHQHPKIDPRRHAWPTHHFALVEAQAFRLRERIESFFSKNLIHPVVENVAARAWQFRGCNPQLLLPCAFSAHRHWRSLPMTTYSHPLRTRAVLLSQL